MARAQEFVAVCRVSRIDLASKRVRDGIKTTLAFILTMAVFAFAQIGERNPAIDESVWASGIPVLEIKTEDCAEIDSREIYTEVESFVLTDPNNPENDVVRNGLRDQIRGRGNSTWNYPKKPYRMRFREPVPLFGNTAQRVWVLLAEYQDPTFITTAVAFELGRRVFNFPFTNSYKHAHLYINDEYQGLYVVTEQVEVNRGRVDIDSRTGWLVEMDTYYDKEPKFRTSSYDLPVMIKSPEFSGAADMTNPAYDFVRNDIDELCDSMMSPLFPGNGYWDLVDIDNVVDFLMINDIVMNDELGHPKSMFAYKDQGAKIGMGPLWDFDWGFGYGYSGHDYFVRVLGRAGKHAFHMRFFEDRDFVVKYMKRMAEKYDEIVGMTAFMDSIGREIEAAVEEDFKIWGNIPGDSHAAQVDMMKEWWQERTEWLRRDLTRPEVTPKELYFDSLEFRYSEVPTQFISLLTIKEINGPAAVLRAGSASPFEIVGDFRTEDIGNGGLVTRVGVRPKKSMWASDYYDTLTMSGEVDGVRFAFSVPLYFTVLKIDPEIPEGITAVYGQTLAEVDLSDYDDWYWMNPNEYVGDVTRAAMHRAVFTPEDTVNYNPIADYYWVAIEIIKADPEYDVPRLVSAVRHEPLANVELPVRWSWMDETELVGEVGARTFLARFTPEDTLNYNILTDIEIRVLIFRKYNDRYGIRFSDGNVTSRETEIRVLLPEGEGLRVTKIMIYDNLGNVVFKAGETSDAVVWNLRNRNGRFVESGTYLVIAKANNGYGGKRGYSAKLYIKRR